MARTPVVFVGLLGALTMIAGCTGPTDDEEAGSAEEAQTASGTPPTVVALEGVNLSETQDAPDTRFRIDVRQGSRWVLSTNGELDGDRYRRIPTQWELDQQRTQTDRVEPGWRCRITKFQPVLRDGNVVLKRVEGRCTLRF
jgi:hypothetical protein